MNFIQAIQTCFSKYAQFSGRARRAEFWWFHLFLFLWGIVLSLVASSLNDFLILVIWLAIIIPTYAVGARRLHDIGKSGWWQLLFLVPVIGIIVLIVWWATVGDRGNNDFGADPLLESADRT